MKKPLLIILVLLSSFIAKGQSYYYSFNKLDSSYTLPKFIGGTEGFTKYIIDNQKDISSYDYSVGKVSVSCYVEKDGKLTHIKFSKTKCSDCDSEAVRLLQLSPTWKTGTHHGKPVAIKMSLQVCLKVRFQEPGDIVIHDNRKITEIIFTATEKEPEYPGGIENFTHFIKSKINIPSDISNVQGKVFVTFVVERNGKLTHVNVLRSPHPVLSKEVLKAVRKSPKWMPGMIRDTTVRTQYTTSIEFP